jgi:hypothetical protein
VLRCASLATARNGTLVAVGGLVKHRQQPAAAAESGAATRSRDFRKPALPVTAPPAGPPAIAEVAQSTVHMELCTCD